jgi:hypothetical protein
MSIKKVEKNFIQKYQHVPDGTIEELEFEDILFDVDFNYFAADPGILSGPPEKCRPPADASFEIVEAKYSKSNRDNPFFSDMFVGQPVNDDHFKILEKKENQEVIMDSIETERTALDEAWKTRNADYDAYYRDRSGRLVRM